MIDSIVPIVGLIVLLFILLWWWWVKKKEEKPKERVSLINRLKGKNRREFLENISYLIIFISAILIFMGILTGSFIQGFVLLASFGSFLVLIGIIIFIISQFLETKKVE